MLTWLLPGLFSTFGCLAAILAWWHSQSTGDEYSVCLIEDESWIDCIDITRMWDTFILYHLFETLHILLDIINETWKSDTFPESWREALIISIPKPGKDHFNPLNYRPIALTSCICKTVERMVNECLVWYLEKNGLLAKQQCGYRANRSTVDHLIRLETFIRDAFIQNQHLVPVFFDLQKSYDTTWKHGIQQDLHDMGLPGNLPIFIGNFLTDRTFQIHLGTILSDVFYQEEGVPQGAILSTTIQC